MFYGRVVNLNALKTTKVVLYHDPVEARKAHAEYGDVYARESIPELVEALYPLFEVTNHFSFSGSLDVSPFSFNTTNFFITEWKRKYLRDKRINDFK